MEDKKPQPIPGPEFRDRLAQAKAAENDAAEAHHAVRERRLELERTLANANSGTISAVDYMLEWAKLQLAVNDEVIAKSAHAAAIEARGYAERNYAEELRRLKWLEKEAERAAREARYAEERR